MLYAERLVLSDSFCGRWAAYAERGRSKSKRAQPKQVEAWKFGNVSSNVYPKC